MCFTPLTTVALGANVGGQLLASQEAQNNLDRQAEARRVAYDAEHARQAAFQRDAGTQFDSSLNAFTPAGQAAARDKAVADRTNTLTTAQKGGAYVPTSGSAPSVVQTTIGKMFANALNRSRTSAENLAKLNAYGDVNLSNGTTLSQSGNKLSDILSMSRGSASLLPYEMSVGSRNAYKPPSIWADLLRAGGTVAAVAGGAGKGPSFSDVGNWFSSAPQLGADGLPWMVP